MNVTDESLEVVFRALDTDDKGYITVDQFTSTLSDFYQSNDPNGRRISTAPCNIDKIVHALDPENDGIIHFADFKKAFQGEIGELKESFGENKSFVLNPSPPASRRNTFLNRSDRYSDGLENKTDDSGIHTHDPSMFDYENDSSLGLEGVHRGPPYGNRRHPDSPASASRSDIIMDDVDPSFEMLRERMRRMEEQVEDINNSRLSESESRIERLRDENARMAAQVTVLEERLKEADARAQRGVESERHHLQSIITRKNHEHTAEVETLRGRIATLESECSDLRIESVRIKADSQASVLDRRRNSEALSDANEQVRLLQQTLQTIEEKHSQELEIIRRDRDHAVHVLEEMNTSVSGRRKSRFGSNSPFSGSITDGSEVMARYNESQEIVRRLIGENKSLRQQLEDAQDQLFARSLEEGRSLVGPTEKSWAAEIDNCTKEEVVELWTREKHINEQLRNYIDSLITRIIERHPSLLEVTNSGKR